jgi:hypothetical protein
MMNQKCITHKKLLCIISMTIIMALFMVLILPVYVYAAGSSSEDNSQNTEVHWRDYNGKRIGVFSLELIKKET